MMDKVSRRDVLWRAWVAVRANDGAPGIDRTILDQVEEYRVARLLDELVVELREGRYRPLPARRVFIPKPETDIAGCFEAIPKDRLMQASRKRVADQPLLKLLRVILRAGVMDAGVVRHSVTGTPQGG